MTAVVAKMASARDMLDMLRRHYVPDPRTPAGIFAPEIAAPGSSRRADLIWQGVTAATDRQLHGHEIKVTRADLLTELADLTKSDPWQQYCDRWWLVVPDPSLLDGLTLPASWGVLTPPSGRRTRSMTVHTPAPALRPDEQAPALRSLATWLHWRLHRCEDVRAGLQQSVNELRTKNQELNLRTPPDPSRRDVVAQIVAQLGGSHYDHHNGRVGEYGNEVTVDDVVAALRDLGEVAHRRDEVTRELSGARRGMLKLREILDRAIEDDQS